MTEQQSEQNVKKEYVNKIYVLITLYNNSLIIITNN